MFMNDTHTGVPIPVECEDYHSHRVGAENGLTQVLLVAIEDTHDNVFRDGHGSYMQMLPCCRAMAPCEMCTYLAQAINTTNAIYGAAITGDTHIIDYHEATSDGELCLVFLKIALFFLNL